jgi:hypothetical protein
MIVLVEGWRGVWDRDICILDMFLGSWSDGGVRSSCGGGEGAGLDPC